MSHQSPLSVLTSSLTSCQGLGCSNAEIAQAADASFSLDVGQTPEPVPNPLDTSSSKSKHRFQLKKRKVSLETVTFDDETSNFKADFLSGIFDDKAKAQDNENPQAPKGSSSRLLNKSLEGSGSRKKARLMPRTMTNCGRSFKNLVDINSGEVQGDSQTHTIAAENPNSCFSQFTSSHQVTPTTIEASPHDNFHNAANIVDQVFTSDLIFPKLPATISQSSCSSNNLTQTSMQAAQVFENPILIEGESKEKDCYGWFVEMEPDDSKGGERSTSTDVYKKSDLSFSAMTAPKKDVQHDADAQWAKAADTVDDVIGDCGFLDL